MSKHNRNRRKYRCPCGNPFNTAIVEVCEADGDEQRKRGVKIPERLPHSCGRCRRISCVDAGQMRYLTPAEELAYRVEYPAAATLQDRAMAANAPDFIGLIPVKKGQTS